MKKAKCTSWFKFQAGHCLKPVSLTCRRCEPSSLMQDSLGLDGGGAAPQASPRPVDRRTVVVTGAVLGLANACECPSCKKAMLTLSTPGRRYGQ